jgi:hypothetical protein
MHSSVPRQRLFLGAVPITSRYYLQEYITLQKLFQLPTAIIYKNIQRYRNVIKIDNDQKLVSSDFFCIFIIFILLI